MKRKTRLALYIIFMFIFIFIWMFGPMIFIPFRTVEEFIIKNEDILGIITIGFIGYWLLAITLTIAFNKFLQIKLLGQTS